MPSVRISHNWRNPNKMEWAGAPEIDTAGRLDRILDLPEPIYETIEKAIAKGQFEGSIYLDDGTRFQWLADI